MPVSPFIMQWIRQMGDDDQVVAFHAYQSLQEAVLRAGAPGKEPEQAELAGVLGQALTAEATPGESVQSRAGGGSLRGNPFLMAVASRAANPLYPAKVRAGLARLLGYLPCEAAVPPLAKALDDLEAREMARCSLECHPSELATAALIGALNGSGSVFCAGVVNSLAKRKGAPVRAALGKAAEDPQPEVRMAALAALAEFPEPAHDAILEKTTRAEAPDERRLAHVARVRLAETLLAGGNRRAAEHIWQSLLGSEAPEPQKKAARRAPGAG